MDSCSGACFPGSVDLWISLSIPVESSLCLDSLARQLDWDLEACLVGGMETE